MAQWSMNTEKVRCLTWSKKTMTVFFSCESRDFPFYEWHWIGISGDKYLYFWILSCTNVLELNARFLPKIEFFAAIVYFFHIMSLPKWTRRRSFLWWSRSSPRSWIWFGTSPPRSFFIFVHLSYIYSWPSPGKIFLFWLKFRFLAPPPRSIFLFVCILRVWRKISPRWFLASTPRLLMLFVCCLSCI